ncbi:TetR/AcrR family transcriptional regulator [Microbacterium indicum]|uniref:TetR/AcrR family transcriptional regulator n=1 Tax=Microbacterium indicum TaxID=358100 RepID=UPI00041E29E6|nr:TetR/AcrR family transcriptional regulator [Microbacterium indicum]
MPRWDPNPRDRLAVAALEMFEERGYDATNVAQIAERAGLTKSTFFRHFRDKREVLFGGGELAELISEALRAAPVGASARDALAGVADAMGASAFTPERHDFVARRHAAIAGAPELQEREALKNVALTRTIADELAALGSADLEAEITARIAALAISRSLTEWIAGPPGAPFAPIARRELAGALAAARGA